MLENLAKLTGSAAVTVENEAYEDDPGNPSVVIVFSEGTRASRRLLALNKK
jgi:hypothetical protein